jgi:hypothetical protein
LNELVAAEMSADEGKPYRISKKRWSWWVWNVDLI